MCDFIFSAPFTWFAQDNKQKINHTQKTQKEQTCKHTKKVHYTQESLKIPSRLVQ